MAIRQVEQRSKSGLAAEVMSRVLKDVKCFPALLPVVQKGLAVVEEENTHAGRLERILSSDPITVARILRLANSAYFGVMAEVRTVSMAIRVIGYRKLRSLLRHILVSGVIELLAQGRPGAGRIRERAVAVSAASHEIATVCRLDDPEELLVAGLLHNIGEMALFWSFPNHYATILERPSPLFALNNAQRAVFGLDSQQVGARVLESWQFPVIFRQVTARWPDPLSEVKDESLRLYLTVVSVAVILVDAMSAGSEPGALEIPEEHCKTLKLSMEDFGRVLAGLPEKIVGIQKMLKE